MNVTKTIEESSLLAATAVPLILLFTQIIAAPFYPGYSFSEQSVSMLGTHFSRHPWVFNLGEILTGVAALIGSVGFFFAFRRRAHVLIAGLIAFAVACLGILSIKAGMFPMPDLRHNSWGLLQNFILVLPHLFLVGLWRERRRRALQIFLVLCVAVMFLLGPLSSRLGRGTLQRLINSATLLPVGVVGFAFWRDRRGEPPHSALIIKTDPPLRAS